MGLMFCLGWHENGTSEYKRRIVGIVQLGTKEAREPFLLRSTATSFIQKQHMTITSSDVEYGTSKGTWRLWTVSPEWSKLMRTNSGL